MNFPKFLRIASIPSVVTNDANGTSVSMQIFGGADDKLTEILSRAIGFTYELVSPTDKEFGRLRSDGSWSGMVGMITRREADLIINSFSITEERVGVLDFTVPYYVGRIVFVTRKPESSARLLSFLQPFSIGVWICFAVAVLTMATMHFVLFHGSGPPPTSRKSDSPPPNTRERALKSCFLIHVAFMKWFYTAVLLSFLTFPTLTGVRSIPELAAAVLEGRYQCTTYPGAFIADHLLKSGNDSVAIGRNLKGSENIDPEAVLSNADPSSKIPAFIAAEKRLASLREKYFLSPDAFFPDFHSIGMRKNFCCRAVLDKVISRVWSSGIYEKTMRDNDHAKMLKVFSQFSGIRSEYGENRLTVRHLQGVFILLIAGHTLAVVVLLVERTIVLSKC